MKVLLIFIGTVALISGAVFPSNVHAKTIHDWYEAESCRTSGCAIYSCERSDTSPAKIYDDAGGNLSPNNSITEKPGGEVDVVIETGGDDPSDHLLSLVFFGSQQACKQFTAPLLNSAEEQHKQEEEQQKSIEEKYR